MAAFLWFATVIACYIIAKKKNRRGWLWLILGIFFSYVTLSILCLKKRLPPKGNYAIPKHVNKEDRTEQPINQQQSAQKQEPVVNFNPNRHEPTAPPVPPVSNNKLININLASEADLAQLPGITTILAKRAVTIRDSKGGYRSIEEFCHELGLSELKKERIKPLITATSSINEMPSYAGKGRTVDF